MTFRHYVAAGAALCAIGCASPEAPKQQQQAYEIAAEAKPPEPESLKCPVKLSDGLDSRERQILEQANPIREIKGYNLFMSLEDVKRLAGDKLREWVPEDPKDMAAYDYEVREDFYTVKLDFAETTWLDPSKFSRPIDEWKEVPMWRSGKRPWLLNKIEVEYDPHADWGDSVEKGLTDNYGTPDFQERGSAITVIHWGDKGRNYLSYIKTKTLKKPGREPYAVLVILASPVNKACGKELIGEFTKPYREKAEKERKKAAEF